MITSVAQARTLHRPTSFWTIQVGAWGAYGISTFLTSLLRIEPEYYAVTLVLKIVRTVTGLALSVVLWRLYRFLELRQASRALLVATVITASAVLGFTWLVIYFQLTQPIRPPALFEPTPAQIPRATLDYAFVFLCWSAAYFAISSHLRAERNEQRALEAAGKARQAQLEMLRYQLNPHFLFNALSSLRASIPLSAEAARGVVDELANFLRHSLQSPNGNGNSLGCEIDAVRSYLAIEKLRFGERLQAQIDVEPGTENTWLPSLLLHPLVENAVKHGLASGVRPLQVTVSARRKGRTVTLHIQNTLGDRISQNGLGVGLENVRRRLELAFPGRSEFVFSRENGVARASIRIDDLAEVE